MMRGNLFLLILMGQCSFVLCRLYEYHFIDTERTWEEAQKYCRDNYSDLASVFDQSDVERLKVRGNEFTEEAWIGLQSIAGKEKRMWHWSLPGVEFNETKWLNGEPNDKGSDGKPENCVAMDAPDKWKDFACAELKQFVCYDDKVILIKESKTWEEALYYCRDNYNDLVSITNLDEQRWVQERAKNASTPFVWLGLRYTCTLDFWFWVSDEVVSYKNWASDGRNDDCDMSGAMKTGGEHQWVTKIDDKKFNFICSK
ncbi:C-type mannose receptor 2-like [Mugil cephalus]|uniref:C-type mannose receptor 2-like n=1 Tax=Mugil cephalus TaxID=48193 RepID=UPI001FB796B2|nr:C-type mannose receptor 2-like [Mugil cephalus]